MYVGLRMIRNVPTVSSDDLVIDADRKMEDNKLWMLLVTERDKLLGYLRKEDIRSALPSPATGLSKHEINYLMSKLTVKKFVQKEMETVTPDTEIEVAADLMAKNNLAGLPVVDREGKLQGYINRSVMLEVLVDEMGLDQGGSRIAFEVEDRTGVMAEVSEVIYMMGLSIISTATFYHNSSRLVVFRIKTDDPSPVEEALKKRGYRMVRAGDFSQEWS